jgi:hypothetical protein
MLRMIGNPGGISASGTFSYLKKDPDTFSSP